MLRRRRTFLSMNIHHLELFYYVAKHEGISNAVRKMPYGIQQPAVSAQIALLEEHLDATLFHRRPFDLTETGQALYKFVEPFFSNLDKMADDLRDGESQRVRVGASHTILSDHMPAIMEKVREDRPDLRVSLRTGHQPALEAALLAREIDVAVTVLEQEPPPGIEARSLLEIPLVLVARRSSKIRSVDDLFETQKITEPLICLPADEPVTKIFRTGLADAGVDWHTTLEVNSFDLAEKLTAKSFGIGLGVVSPSSKRVPGVRAIPLPDFPTLKIGVLWQGKLEGLLKSFVEGIEWHVGNLKQMLADEARAAGESA
ncbi:MAG: LysR family transcriptional regulator [Verrucomicrobiota bacterium]|jgi:DNA-binding transcriptional LysR family regulator|nr:LysR family transcriptional regulator [Verrucomicrobiota bacterium]